MRVRAYNKINKPTWQLLGAFLKLPALPVVVTHKKNGRATLTGGSAVLVTQPYPRDVFANEGVSVEIGLRTL